MARAAFWHRCRPVMFRVNGVPELVQPITGSGKKFHSRWTRYFDGVLHSECPPGSRELCPVCQLKWHKAQRCLLPDCRLPHWYQSKAEASTALRLDRDLKDGKIAGWRHARTVELEPKRRGQRSIKYTPDFVVTLRDGAIEAWEVKSYPTLTPSSRIRIKLYRARAAIYGWPPLRVLTGSGRTIDFLR